MSDYQSKRMFIAIVPDAVVRADIADAVSGVEAPGLRLTAAENLHITVKFLGDVPDPDTPGILEALEEAARDVGVFELNSGPVIVLPDLHRPRVLAVQFDCPQELTRLVDQIEDAMEACGFRREGRAFRTHLTVGRFKFRGRSPRDFRRPVIDLPPTGFRVESMTLMQSDLKPDGPVYTPQAEFKLNS